MQVYNLPQLTNYRTGWNGVQFCMLGQNTLFISGGHQPYGPSRDAIHNCYTLNLSTERLVSK